MILLICPFCGKEMTAGQLTGDGRAPVRFIRVGAYPTKLDRLLADPNEGRLRAAKGNVFTSFKIDSHYCPDCKKMIIETDIQ